MILWHFALSVENFSKGLTCLSTSGNYYLLIDPSTVAVLRDQTRVIRWLSEALLESLPLDHVELRPSQFSLALSYNEGCLAHRHLLIYISLASY